MRPYFKTKQNKIKKSHKQTLVVVIVIMCVCVCVVYGMHAASHGQRVGFLFYNGLGIKLSHQGCKTNTFTSQECVLLWHSLVGQDNPHLDGG